MTVLSVESMDESLETRYVSPTRLVCLGNRIEKLQGRSSTWIMLQITQINITDFFELRWYLNRTNLMVKFNISWCAGSTTPSHPVRLCSSVTGECPPQRARTRKRSPGP